VDRPVNAAERLDRLPMGSFHWRAPRLAGSCSLSAWISSFFVREGVSDAVAGIETNRRSLADLEPEAAATPEPVAALKGVH
jgi:hypothetical protein